MIPESRSYVVQKQFLSFHHIYFPSYFGPFYHRLSYFRTTVICTASPVNNIYCMPPCTTWTSNKPEFSWSVCKLKLVYILQKIYKCTLKKNIRFKIKIKITKLHYETLKAESYSNLQRKELSCCNKLTYSSPYIFATWWCKPLIFQT